MNERATKIIRPAAPVASDATTTERRQKATVGSAMERARAGAHLTMEEIGLIAGLHPRTIRRMILAGKFPPAQIQTNKRVLRWTRAQYESLLALSVDPGRAPIPH